MKNNNRSDWMLGPVLVVAILLCGPYQRVHAASAESEEEQTLREWLTSEYELRPRYVKGQQSYYRLWQTLEFLDAAGNLMGRSQWRGDFERVVVSVNVSGRAEEKITWKNVGSRNWSMGEGEYGDYAPLSWADGFSYTFSSEDGYDDLSADYDSIPKNVQGMLFRLAFQVTAHLEFDFLRSSSHANIERLREVGSVLLSPPEDGQKFSLDFPPFVVNSDLEKKHVAVGFLGLTQVNGEPCAIIDYQQGPQDFLWEMPGSSSSTLGLDEEAGPWHAAVKSWHYGLLYVRLRDGSLVSGWLVEPTLGKWSPEGEGQPVYRYGRGTWSIREISAEDYALGLKDWDDDNLPVPLFRPIVGSERD